MGLRIYTVHLPPAAAADPLPVLVKEGFSWPAFFFGVVWALWHRLWIEAAGLLALLIAVGAGLDTLTLGEPAESLIGLAVALFVGFHGNDWRRASLRRRGYGEAGVVAGPELDSALRRFLDLRAVASHVAHPAVAIGAPAVAPAAASGSIAGWYSTAVQPSDVAEHRSSSDAPWGGRAGA